MMKHSSDGYRTVWHAADPCDECGQRVPSSTVSEGTQIGKSGEKDIVVEPAFAGGLFDAPPPVGKYTREELEAQARAKRMAGPPRMFPVGIEACPDCGASFRPAPPLPSFGVVIMHKCGEDLRAEEPAMARADYENCAACMTSACSCPRAIATDPVAAALAVRTYGRVYLSHNIASCGRCGADPSALNVERDRFSWSHACVP